MSSRRTPSVDPYRTAGPPLTDDENLIHDLAEMLRRLSLDDDYTCPMCARCVVHAFDCALQVLMYRVRQRLENR